MLTLHLDLETTITTPVDPTQCRIIELGGLVWDWETGTPAQFFNYLIWGDQPEYVWTDSIRELTGMQLRHLMYYGGNLKEALEKLYWEMISPVEMVHDKKITHFVAHNGTIFDKVVFNCELERAKGIMDERSHAKLSEMQWLDSMTDIPWPKEISTRKLKYLAAEMGVVNPYSHRSLTDSLTMTEIIKGFPLSEIIARSLAPKCTAVADCKKPWEDPAPEGQKGVDFAKTRGYKFRSDSKKWCKEILESEFEAEKDACKEKFRVGKLVRKE